MFHKQSHQISVVPETKVKWKGVLDWDYLYKHMKWTLHHMGFGDENSNFKEIQFTERLKGEAKQLEILWMATKSQSPFHVFI